MKGEIIFCAIPGCDSHWVCAPDRGPKQGTWICDACEADQLDAYFRAHPELQKETSDRADYCQREVEKF